MSIDQVTKMVVKMTADNTDLVGKMREVQGEERKLADEQRKTAEAKNRSLEMQIALLGKATAAIDVGKDAWSAFKHSAEQARLSAAAFGVDIEKLQRASAGLKSRTELLTFAAQAQRGALKLTTAEMADAQRAIRAFTQAGFEHAKASEAVTQAVVEGEAEGLKKLGIVLRETKTDSERYLAIKEALTGQAQKVSDGSKTEMEAILGVGTRFKDATDRITSSVGDLVVAFGPLLDVAGGLVEKAADVVSLAGKGWKALSLVAQGDRDALFNLFGRESDPARGFMGKNGVWIDGGHYAEHIAAGGTMDNYVMSTTGGIRGSRVGLGPDTSVAYEESLGAQRRRREARERAEREAHFERTGFYPEEEETKVPLLVSKAPEWMGADALAAAMAARIAGNVERSATDALVAKLEGELYSQTGRDFVGPSLGFSAGAVDDDALQKMIAKLGGGGLDPKGYEKFNAARSQSKLAKVFGPLEDFDAYSKAFRTLSGAAHSAFGAWIDGSMSAGDAIKKFFADSLKGQAVDMLGRAALHTAYAIGSGAFGDAVGATKHGIAAAQYAAGAVIVGGLAKALHGSADVPTGSGGGGGVSAGGGRRGSGPSGRPVSDAGTHEVYTVGGSNGPTGPMVVVQGDPHALDSPRRRAANFRDAYGRVVGRNGVEHR